jgi:hypothetical protein
MSGEVSGIVAIGPALDRRPVRSSLFKGGEGAGRKTVHAKNQRSSTTEV